MRNRILILLGLIGALLIAAAVYAQGSVTNVDWWVIAGGGAPSSGGDDVILNDTLGQPIVGPSSGTEGQVTLSAGYWISGANINREPTFTSTPVLTATEGTPYTATVTADDPDLAHGDALTISAPLLPGWLSLADHSDGTAILFGTPTNADVGKHSVELGATDSGGLTATQTFIITVTVDEPHYRIYLPLIIANYLPGA